MDIPKSLWIDNNDGKGKFRNPELTDEEFNAGLEEMKNNNIDALWQKATDYMTQYISNAAFGLVTKGSLKNLPKCIAVETWINNIWSLYYTRKELITYEWNDSLYDFSICGPMPYTVPELTKEVYG
jgi:hypothetical protein